MTEREKYIINECKSILKKYPNLKKRGLNRIKDLEKRMYYHICWYVTESQPLHILKNHDKRCFKCFNGYHLDHIYPISAGYHNNIPPEKIGHISNLRFIPVKENMKKGHKITNESRRALKNMTKRKKY